MAGKSMTIAFATTFLVAIALFGSSDAVTYNVGDSGGWTQPSNANDDVYDNWALGKNFTVGDVLIFTFTTGSHDVAQVSAQSYDDCIGTNPINLITAGPASVTLTTAGMNYFICTKAGHCDAGQTLKVNVLAATGSGSPPATTTPSPPGTVTSSPPPPSSTTNSAAPVAASVGVFGAFLTVAAAILV